MSPWRKIRQLGGVRRSQGRCLLLRDTTRGGGGREGGGFELKHAGTVRDKPSHGQESLETLSAVALQLCLLFLVFEGGRRGGIFFLES
ncbi:hypothetical protein GOODEAATRI_021873, partial [Goodea atripinnis]